jgi:hypothetical protein
VAKKRKIMVDVVVDDKGTTKKMAVSQRQLDGAMKDTEKSTRQARKQIRGAAQTASAGGKQFAALASGTGGLVGAYATLAAQIFAVTAAFNFLKEAGSLKLLQEGQLAYTAAVGTSMKSLTMDIQAATGAQLGFREAAQAGAIATAAGLSPDQIVALGKAAKDTSTVLGRDLTDSFNRLVRGVTKAEPELLDELGIILRLEKATTDYKTSLGITGELSAFQRSQAVTADVLEQVEKKYARILAVTGESTNEFQKLATAFDEIIMSIQEFAVKFLTPVAQLLQKFPQLIIAAFAPFTISILRAALPSLAGLQESLGVFADKAKTSFAQAQAAQAKFNNDVTRLAASKATQKALLKEIGAETKAATAKVKIRKNSLLQSLRNGEKLDARQIRAIRRNLERQARGYEIKDKRVLRSLEKSLKKMELLNKATTDKMKLQFQTLGAKISSSVTAATVQAKSAIASLASFTAKAAGFMATALGAISWITLIVSLGALAYAFIRGSEETEEITNKFQHLIDKEKQLREESDKVVQVQNILNEEFERGTQMIAAYGARLNDISTKSLGQMVNQEAATKAIEAYSRAVEKARKEVEKYDKALKASQGAAAAGSTRSGQAGSRRRAQREVASGTVLQKDLDDATRRSNESFADFIMRQEGMDESTQSALATLGRELDELKALDNELFSSNKLIQEYRKNLEGFIGGNEELAEKVFSSRDAIIELRGTIEGLTRATEENISTNLRLRMKQFPITEADAFVTALKAEQRELTKLIATQEDGKAIESQVERQKELNKQLDFFTNAAALETQVKRATLEIQIQEAKLLAGKTKLLQNEVRSRAKIAQNQIKIFEAEQKIARARSLLSQDQIKAQRTLADTSGEVTATQRDEAQQILDGLDARQRVIMLEEGKIGLLRVQTSELERQLNTTQQLRDASLQAFESSAQSGIAALIKGTKDFKDALTDLATSVLNSIADTLARQITTRIMGAFLGVKDPAVEMSEAIRTSTETGADTFETAIVRATQTGANALANAVAGGAPGITQSESGAPTGVRDVATNGDEEEQKKKRGLFSYLFARGGEQTGGSEGTSIDPKHGKVEEQKVVGKPLGIFGPFLNDFSAIFEQNTAGGFLGQLGKTFMSGAEGFGSLFTDLLGGLFGGGGGGGLGGLLGGIFGFRYGGISSYRYGGMSDRYSTGGIARGPQAGYPAVLHGNEAIVPLPSGGKIPVEMKGGAGQTNNVGVTVNISGDGQATTEMQGDPGKSEVLGKLVAGAVQEELQKQRRPGGILSPYGAAGGI